MAVLRPLACEDIGLAVIPPMVVQDELASGFLVKAAKLDGLAEAFLAVTRDRLTHHCEIVETGNESWRFKTGPDARRASSAASSGRQVCERPEGGSAIPQHIAPGQKLSWAKAFRREAAGPPGPPKAPACPVPLLRNKQGGSLNGEDSSPAAAEYRRRQDHGDGRGSMAGSARMPILR